MATFFRARIPGWRVLINGDSLPPGYRWAYDNQGHPIYAADGRRVAVYVGA